MKNYKYKLGTCYKVKFYDHCTGIRKPTTCEVVGWLIDNEETFISLSHWKLIDTDQSAVEDNYEPTTVLKSCILSVRKLI